MRKGIIHRIDGQDSNFKLIFRGCAAEYVAIEEKMCTKIHTDSKLAHAKPYHDKLPCE